VVAVRSEAVPVVRVEGEAAVARREAQPGIDQEAGAAGAARARAQRIRSARRVHRGAAEIPSAPPTHRPLRAEPHATLAARLEIAAPRHGRVAGAPAVAPAHSGRPALPQFERSREATRHATPRPEARRGEIEHFGREGAEQRYG